MAIEYGPGSLKFLSKQVLVDKAKEYIESHWLCQEKCLRQAIAYCLVDGVGSIDKKGVIGLDSVLKNAKPRTRKVVLGELFEALPDCLFVRMTDRVEPFQMIEDHWSRDLIFVDLGIKEEFTKAESV